MEDSPPIFSNAVALAYFSVFGALVVGSLLSLRMEPRRKDLWRRRTAVAAGVLLGGVPGVAILFSSAPWFFVVLWNASWIGVTYVNGWVVQTCLGCGKTVNPVSPLRKAQFCPKCGTPLAKPQE